jgi:hypothetical protein
MNAAQTGRPRSDVPWDLSFLRVGVAVTGVVALVAALVTGLTVGWPAAIGVLVGAAVVSAFVCVSGVVVAWAGRLDDSITLPAALGTFLVKALVLFALLSALPEEGWLDRSALAWAVIVGALLWSAVHLRWVWTRQLYYVPPPAAPAPSVAQPHQDPEKPASSG